MTDEEQEQLQVWFEKHDAYDNPDSIDFDDLVDKPFENEQICAAVFLYEKLKKDEKVQPCCFFHGEHDNLYIGSSFEIFEPFTEEEVKRAISFGIRLADDGDGFSIYASM